MGHKNEWLAEHIKEKLNGFPNEQQLEGIKRMLLTPITRHPNMMTEMIMDFPDAFEVVLQNIELLELDAIFVGNCFGYLTDNPVDYTSVMHRLLDYNEIPPAFWNTVCSQFESKFSSYYDALITGTKTDYNALYSMAYAIEIIRNDAQVTLTFIDETKFNDCKENMLTAVGLDEAVVDHSYIYGDIKYMIKTFLLGDNVKQDSVGEFASYLKASENLQQSDQGFAIKETLGKLYESLPSSSTIITAAHKISMGAEIIEHSCNVYSREGEFFQEENLVDLGYIALLGISYYVPGVNVVIWSLAAAGLVSEIYNKGVQDALASYIPSSLSITEIPKIASILGFIPSYESVATASSLIAAYNIYKAEQAVVKVIYSEEDTNLQNVELTTNVFHMDYLKNCSTCAWDVGDEYEDNMNQMQTCCEEFVYPSLVGDNSVGKVQDVL